MMGEEQRHNIFEPRKLDWFFPAIFLNWRGLNSDTYENIKYNVAYRSISQHKQNFCVGFHFS